MRKAGLVLGIIAGIIICIISCDKLQSDHPQAELETSGLSTLNEDKIKAYEDSVNLSLSRLRKEESLVYESGDYSFYITKFTSNGEPVLFIENGNNGEYGRTEKRYYVKDQHLILYTEQTSRRGETEQVQVQRLYFRNNTLFNAEEKSGENGKTLKDAAFKAFDPHKKDQYTDLSQMEDALQQRGRFNLVFEGVTQYPGAQFLILSRNEVNSYRAVLRIDREDDLIHELSTNPTRYLGAQFDLNWQVNRDGDAVYKGGQLKR